MKHMLLSKGNASLAAHVKQARRIPVVSNVDNLFSQGYLLYVDFREDLKSILESKNIRGV